MIKIVKTHRKPQRSKFHIFSMVELKFAAEIIIIIVYCQLCNLLQNSTK